MGKIRILYPFKMAGRYEDGTEIEVGGMDEEDCMSRLIDVHNGGKHGNLEWYSGVSDDDYIDGEKIPDEWKEEWEAEE